MKLFNIWHGDFGSFEDVYLDAGFMDYPPWWHGDFNIYGTIPSIVEILYIKQLSGLDGVVDGCEVNLS